MNSKQKLKAVFFDPTFVFLLFILNTIFTYYILVILFNFWKQSPTFFFPFIVICAVFLFYFYFVLLLFYAKEIIKEEKERDA